MNSEEDETETIQDICRKLHSNEESFRFKTLLLEGPLGFDEQEAVVAGLRANTTVTHCMLWDHTTSGPLMNYMSTDFLLSHPSLERLEFESCMVSTQHASDFAASLKRPGCRLKEIGLHDCDVDDGAAKLLADAIQANEMLEGFDLYSKNIGAEGSTAIISAVHKSKLKHFGLHGSNVGDGGISIANLIRASKTLTHLRVSFYDLSVEGTRTILAALPETKLLQNLDVNTKNYKGAQLMPDLSKAIRYNGSLQFLHLGGCNLAKNTQLNNLKASLTLNHKLLRFSLGRVPKKLKAAIDRNCNENEEAFVNYGVLKAVLPTLELSLWPKALELVARKPDMLFDVIKQKSNELFRERRPQRSRKRPRVLGY